MEPKNNFDTRVERISSPEVEEYVPQFFVTQEALQFYGIEVHEKTPERPGIEGTLGDIKVREKIYETLVNEIQRGNTHLLEFILSEKILNKYELREYGIRSLKQDAEKILSRMTGQQRARDIDSFLEAGILTQDEVSTLTTSGNQG